MKVKNMLYVSIIFLFVFIGFNLFNTYLHEAIHQQIGKGHLCVEDKMVLFPNPYWVCLQYETRTSENRLQERNLHAINEIVGYPLGLVINVIIAMTFINIISRGN